MTNVPYFGNQNLKTDSLPSFYNIFKPPLPLLPLFRQWVSLEQSQVECKEEQKEKVDQNT